MNLMDKIKSTIGLATTLEKLTKKYNLTEYRDRWRSYYVSKEVNHLVDKVAFGASCGCCPDAVVYARSYLEEDGIKIYADPVNLRIGDKYGFAGIYPDKYNASHLPQAIQDEIAQHLKDNPPENNYESDE